MKRPAALFVCSGVLGAAYAVARGAGLVEHTNAITGMATSSTSLVLGPLYVALYMLVVTAGPVLSIAATIDTLLVLRRRQAPPTEVTHM